MFFVVAVDFAVVVVVIVVVVVDPEGVVGFGVVGCCTGTTR
jgi:hypothetical protein